MKAAVRAGILAAVAIALTGGSARAEEPIFTPAAAPVSPTPATTPASPALPWLAQPSPSAAFTAPESHSSSRMMWLVLPALALGGAALYMRLAKRRGTTTAPRRLEVIDTARLGPKAQVVMVSVGKRTLLLGVTDQSVQRLAWLSNGINAEAPAEKQIAKTIETPVEEPPSERHRAPDGPFAHLLKTFTHKVNSQSGSDAALQIAAETKDFVERHTTTKALAAAPESERETPRPAMLVVGAQNDIEEQVSGLRKRRSGKKLG
jgi:flagellar biogenesis protein FliO